MHNHLPLYTATRFERRPVRETEREYFMRLARERRAARRAGRGRRLIGRLIRRPHGRPAA
ncbi:MAG TPA: hypothetical protein VE777_11380 [Gaiellales bacterium]|nr:hypothetical protein [Gaiellales bacterium]